jgi:predicted transcriptional regulator
MNRSDLVKQAKSIYAETGSKRKTAELMGASRTSVQRYLKEHSIEIEQPPSYDNIADLIEHKKKIFAHKSAVSDFEKLINVTVKDDGAIAICLIGDPHIDDDGCDIIGLEHDLEVISKTDAMYAGHLGDLTNNWVGRLARLYANQSTTSAQAIQLMEWMLNKAPNLFVVGGNHDCWNNGMDIISFIMRQYQSAVSAHGVRIALNFPNGKQVRINARHDFKGYSMFNPNHGHRRETLWGYKDHILVSGHRHTDGVSVIPSNEGLCHWMFQVSGYKVFDDYAKEHGFHEQRMGSSVTVVINPNAKCEAELVKPFWDVDTAANYLTWLRSS